MKYKLQVVANLRFHLYAHLLFLTPHFSVFWDAVTYVIKVKYKITEICLIRGNISYCLLSNTYLYFNNNFLIITF